MGLSHGYDASQNDNALSHLDGSPFISERIRAGVLCFWVATGVGKREGWPMREDIDWEGKGGGRGGGELCVQVKLLASPPLIKNKFEKLPTFGAYFWHAAIIMHFWSAALSRIDSRWKECTIAQHKYVMY